MISKRKSFIVGLKSTKLSKNEILFLKKYKPWGIILFTRNIKSFDQVKKLTSSIRKIFKDKKYPIMIDQEGGRVNRLEKFISLDSLTSEYFGPAGSFARNHEGLEILFEGLLIRQFVCINFRWA